MTRFDRYLSKRRPDYRPESATDLGDRFRVAMKRLPVNLIQCVDPVLHATVDDLWRLVKGLIVDHENEHDPDGEKFVEVYSGGWFEVVRARPIFNRKQYDAARRYLILLERLGAVRDQEEHHVA